MIETLNSDCLCVSLDPAALRSALEADPATRGVHKLIEERCPHLFAALPVFVSRQHVDAMAEVVTAVETVVALPAYRDALAWAPAVARFEPGARGVFMGYDFHLGAQGPGSSRSTPTPAARCSTRSSAARSALAARRSSIS